MKKQKLFLILPFLIFTLKSSSQDFLLTQPRLVFDGNQLLITYDVINKNKSDQFYVWVEMWKENGEPVRIKALSGDVGDSINGGENKKITWIPARDSIFIDEKVFVEVKAEKYIKSFNKGSMLLMSAAFPGWGQTKISNGKPWWLTGVAAYGALVGGFIAHTGYLKTYDSYLLEEDIEKRSDLSTKAQNQLNISGALYITAAAIWAVNIFWVALIPDNYKPLQHVKLSFYPINSPSKAIPLLTFRSDF
jgi:hypothetical protein